MLTIMLFALCAVAVVADPTPPVNAPTLINSTSRNVSGLAAQSVQARGGNVTQVNIDALTITKSWQGYYGQVHGEIALETSAGSKFYNWTLTSVSGRVYATRATTITWTNVNCTNSTNMTTETTFLGLTASDGDSVINTFNSSTHPAFNVSTSVIVANTCQATSVFVNNASQTSNWRQVLLTDRTSNNIIYTTIMNASTVGFDGGTYDFQLLVGENEHTGSIGVTNYYFWVELN